MKIGYVRVSTAEQNTARQEVLMEQLGVEKVYIDKQSGKNADRQELKKMLDFVREGDVLIVESYSRLARNTKDLLEIVERLNGKGVSFVSQKENIDTSTAQGRLMLTIFAGLAQFEREQLLQRQAEGVTIAKENGVYKGRVPVKYDKELFEKVYKKWKAGKMLAKDAMKAVGLTTCTFYRRVKDYEEENGIRAAGEKRARFGHDS